MKFSKLAIIGVVFGVVVACFGHVASAQQEGCAPRTITDKVAIEVANAEMERFGFTDLKDHKVFSDTSNIKKFCDGDCKDVQAVVTMNANHWAANGTRGYKICINKEGRAK